MKTKPSPLTVSLADWPRVTIRGENVTLPMPKPSYEPYDITSHICPTASRDECASCKRLRNRADKKYVRDMFEATGRVAANFKRENEEWET